MTKSIPKACLPVPLYFSIIARNTVVLHQQGELTSLIALHYHTDQGRILFDDALSSFETGTFI